MPDLTSLSRDEQETIINFNKAEPYAEVYTHEYRFIKRLDMIADKFPAVCRFEKENAHGGRTYSILKRYIRIGIPREQKDGESQSI